MTQALEDLDKQLKKLGTRLFVVRGNPKEVFENLFKEWNVKKLTYEKDTEPYGVKRDTEIETLAEKFNIEVVTKTSHTLFEPQKVVRANKGVTPTTYQKFCSVATSLGKPEKPVPTLDKIPKECCVTSDLNEPKYNVPL